MKFTKAQNLRIAVVSKKLKDGRGILYPAPNKEMTIPSVEEQIEARVEQANKRYHLFFQSDIPDKLGRHFEELVQIAGRSKDVDIFFEKAKAYKGYWSKNKNGESYQEEMKKFSYAPSGKKLKNVLDIYVRERMVDEWQSEVYKAAAVEVLCCICDKKYNEKIGKLSTETKQVFLEASKKCENPCIEQTTKDLELYFTALMKNVVKDKYENKNDKVISLKEKKEELLEDRKKYIQDKIKQMKCWKFVFADGKKIPLEKICYPYATEDRLRAVLVRMRKSIKRDTNGEVAILLLQGLSQMDGKTLAKVLEEMQSDARLNEALEKFLLAVEEDYWKRKIIKSIKNHDVKVQVQNQRLDLSSRNMDKVSEKKKYKAALNDTLELYASSKEGSDKVLQDIKGVLFDFFLWNDSRVKEEFLIAEKLWKIPNRIEEYFDTDFVSEDKNKQKKAEACMSLEHILEPEKPNGKELKARINYVNCGKYQQLMKEETDEFRKYWITYAKDYVEKNYVAKKRRLKREDCYSTSMLLGCWKDILRFLCGKYMDIGKAVYHFAMPSEMSVKAGLEYGSLQEKYRDGISSFAYESIKAEENLQRDIANAVVAAAAAFSRSAMDREKMMAGEKTEDPMFINQNLELYMKEEEIVKKMLLRFYGGASTIEANKQMELKGIPLAKEVLSHIKAIRNENFHFTDGKKVTLDTIYTKMLWEHERIAYQQMVKEKYYFNNTAKFYSEDEIRKLVIKLYSENGLGEAQIPSFRTIWKRKELPEYIKEQVTKEKEETKKKKENEKKLCSFQEVIAWNKNDERHTIFQGALYFLLKEIYYRDFILSENKKEENQVSNSDKKKKSAGEFFFEAVEDYATESKAESDADKKNKDKKNAANAGRNFKIYVFELKEKYEKGELTFGNICQLIQTEYNQQNGSGQEEEIYKHFKMLLPICMQKAFQKYIDENYAFLKEPKEQKVDTVAYLDEVTIDCMDMDEEQAHWFTFAHFIHPKQLNFLVGNFKDYIQYKQDVLRRSIYAGQLQDEKEFKAEQKIVEDSVNKAWNILKVLEFVRHVSGKVSNEYQDYYEDKEAYARYLSQYIEFEKKESKTVFESLKYFCQNTLKDGQVIDIYADEVNPKVLRNIELARMYAGGDLALPKYPKIKKEEIVQYYKKRKEVAQIQANGMCTSSKDQKKVVEFQQLKGRITLNEVTDLFSLVNDLLGQLVSLSYLWERDEMYLFLGFYYMALRNEDGWKEEVLNKLETEKYKVKQGLVLYQTVSLFDFGTKLLCKKEEKWCEQTGYKWKYFIENHKESCSCVLRLFQAANQEDEVKELRNYVDHSKYYLRQDKSILELYSAYYTKMFAYSNKLRKSVLFNLESMLEKYFVDGKLKFKDRETVVFDKENTKSQKFIYKYKQEKKEEDRGKEQIRHSVFEQFKNQENSKEQKEDEKKQEIIKMVQIEAKSKRFVDGMMALLEYKQE